ncbi:MAG: hypothetical protein COX62_05205, partial [Deltaproteobacteria bacterium CG_4_10_14_0_2_um_filter_43_8]
TVALPAVPFAHFVQVSSLGAQFSQINTEGHSAARSLAFFSRAPMVADGVTAKGPMFRKCRLLDSRTGERLPASEAVFKGITARQFKNGVGNVISKRIRMIDLTPGTSETFAHMLREFSLPEFYRVIDVARSFEVGALHAVGQANGVFFESRKNGILRIACADAALRSVGIEPLAGETARSPPYFPNRPLAAAEARRDQWQSSVVLTSFSSERTGVWN